jgi:hypothetical protein
MSEIGDILDSHDDVFGLVEDTLTVRNYIEAGQPDDRGDTGRVEHPDSPQSASGSIELRGRPSVESEARGLDTEADARIFVDGDAAFVTEGGASFNGTEVPYPTEIEDTDGTVYVVVDRYDPGHGRLKCLGRSD